MKQHWMVSYLVKNHLTSQYYVGVSRNALILSIEIETIEFSKIALRVSVLPALKALKSLFIKSGFFLIHP